MSDPKSPTTLEEFMKLVVAFGEAAMKHGAMNLPSGTTFAGGLPMESLNAMTAAQTALLSYVSPALQRAIIYPGGMPVVDLLLRLKKIASVNQDRFLGKLLITLDTGVGGIEFEETADGHHFFGTTLQDKNQFYRLWTRATEEGLKNACKAWNYKYPEPDAKIEKTTAE